MIRLGALMLMLVLVCSGCGGQASGSQEATGPAMEAQYTGDTEVSAPTRIWRGGEQAATLEETANEPIETPIAEVVGDTDADKEKTETSPAQGSPDLLGGNLWIAGQANVLSEEVEKSLSAGFEWGADSTPESRAVATNEAVQQDSDVQEELAAIRAEQATILAEMKTLRAQAEDDRLAAASETEASRKQMAEENALAKAELQKELDRMKADAEQERLATIGQAEADRIRSEHENALAKAEAQKELDRLKAEAEKERMVAIAQAEADRIKAEQKNALAKAEALEELDRMKADAEKERLTALSDAEAARKETEKLALARAEAEAALLEARNMELETREEIEVAAAPSPKPPPARSGPAGSIELIELDLSAQRDGVFGVELASDALIENLNGTKIELAAYFYDDKGKPLKDSDKVNRSSKGQVYVGKESMVSSDNYALKDKLFIPFEQLELAMDVEHAVQVELVLWEYSHGRGNRLASTPKTTFKHVANAPGLARDELHRSDLTGNWRNGNTLITMAQQDNTIVLNGLTVVPHNIVSETWTYERGRLQGMVINKRKLPPVTRIWRFDLRISQDGNTLTGTYHRADRKGNFGFDSEPFVWTRMP
ncbi:MAG: hypothetical protein VCD00_02915 [Candidatus Hydrogenedentota bacterium]